MLDRVSVTVARGEVVSLVGPSGSGKSTLLRVIAGLHEPDNGSVSCDGEPLDGVAAHRRRFGFVFQDEQLFPHRDVAGNVAFGLRMTGTPKAAATRRVTELLDLVRLPGFASRRVGDLSGGEAKRVALARALAPAPRLLLLDEPLTGLDGALHDQLAIDLRAVLMRPARPRSSSRTTSRRRARWRTASSRSANCPPRPRSGSSTSLRPTRTICDGACSRRHPEQRRELRAGRPARNLPRRRTARWTRSSAPRRGRSSRGRGSRGRPPSASAAWPSISNCRAPAAAWRSSTKACAVPRRCRSPSCGRPLGHRARLLRAVRVRRRRRGVRGRNHRPRPPHGDPADLRRVAASAAAAHTWGRARRSPAPEAHAPTCCAVMRRRSITNPWRPVRRRAGDEAWIGPTAIGFRDNLDLAERYLTSAADGCRRLARRLDLEADAAVISRRRPHLNQRRDGVLSGLSGVRPRRSAPSRPESAAGTDRARSHPDHRRPGRDGNDARSTPRYGPSATGPSGCGPSRRAPRWRIVDRSSRATATSTGALVTDASVTRMELERDPLDPLGGDTTVDPYLRGRRSRRCYGTAIRAS